LNVESRIDRADADVPDGSAGLSGGLETQLTARSQGAEPHAPSCLESAACWRVHFHLPVFLAELPECLSTQRFLREFLPLVSPSVPLEVETYTFDVLPPELQTPTVVESIVREIEWVEACRAGRLED